MLQNEARNVTVTICLQSLLVFSKIRDARSDFLYLPFTSFALLSSLLLSLSLSLFLIPVTLTAADAGH